MLFRSVEHFSDDVAVVYLGRVAEAGPTGAVFGAPRHPYTQALLAAVPQPDPDHVLSETAAMGEIASALDPPAGCRFHPRCPLVIDVCRSSVPPLRGAPHAASCHLVEI